MSKESTSKTLSLLMQTNFSGRAEIGLTGDDDFHLKVSPDGSSWFESLIIAKSSGKVGLAIDGSATAPALTWAGDPDNGLYRTGANAWSLACAGAQAIGITATAISIPYATAASSIATGALTMAGGAGVKAAQSLSAATTTVSNLAIGASGSDYPQIGYNSRVWWQQRSLDLQEQRLRQPYRVCDGKFRLSDGRVGDGRQRHMVQLSVMTITQGRSFRFEHPALAVSMAGW